MDTTESGNGGNVVVEGNWIEPTTTNDLVINEFSTNVTVDSNFIVSHPKPQA